MSISRVLVALLLFLLAAVVAVLCYLHFADLNRHRGRLEGIVSEATGREFHIRGNIDLELLPVIGLQVDGLSLANADWGSEPVMAEVEHVLVQIRPASLLFGPIEVIDVQLAGGNLLLETDAAGASNWAFETAAEEKPAEKQDDSGSGATGGLAFIIDNARLDNLTATLRQEGAEDQVFHLEELAIAADETDQMKLSGQADILQLPVSLSGRAGTRSALAEFGTGDFNLSLALGTLEVELSGNRMLPGSGQDSTLQATIRAADLAAFLDSLALDAPLAAAPLSLTATLSGDSGSGKLDLDGNLGEVRLNAEASAQAGELKFNGQVATLEQLGALLEVAGLPARALDFTGALISTDDTLQLQDIRLETGDALVTVEGTLSSGAEAAGKNGSSLQIEARGQSLAALMTTLPELPFEMTAVLAMGPDLLRLEPFKLRAGNSDLAGSVNVAAGAIDAELSSRRLDLLEFSAGEASAESGEVAAGGATDAPPPSSAPEKDSDSRYVFRDEPLPLDTLRNSEMNLRLSVEEFLADALTLENLEVVSTLHEGNLDLAARFDTPKGGRGDADVQLRASGPQAELLAQIKARDLRANIMSGTVESADDIPPIDVTLDINSAGNSPRAIAANSNGNILVTLGPGLMDASALDLASGDILAQLLSALNPFANRDPHSQFQCGVIAVTIEDGVSKLKPLMLQSQRLLITAGGTLDLNTEKLDFEFNTKPREGVGVSADMFVTPFVALRGTLAAPGIGVNETGTLLAAGAAVATGGLSFLYKGLADRATGAIDQCKETMPKFTHPPIGER